MIDSDLRPWILEANLCPSFATDSTLDFVIKSNLLKDTFNLLCIKKYDKKKDPLSKMKKRFQSYMKVKNDTEAYLVSHESPEKNGVNMSPENYKKKESYYSPNKSTSPSKKLSSIENFVTN